MSTGRLSVPDLDILESPLLSPSSFIGLGSVPHSAIAEKIFNDPHSWDEVSGDEVDYPEDIDGDTLLWFAEGLEKLRIQRANSGKAPFDLSRGDKKDSREAGLVPNREGNGGWKDIARRRSVRPISLAALFEHFNDDFSTEIQQHLSNILDSGKYHIGPRSSFIPPYMNTPSTADSISSALTSTTTSPRSSMYSTSATLSILEYYGSYPDSPLFDTRKLPRKRTLRKSKDSLAEHKLSPPYVSSPEIDAKSTPPGLASVRELEPFQPPADSGSPPTTPVRHDEPSPSLHTRQNSNASTSDSTPRSRPLPIATGPSPAHSCLDPAPTTGTSPVRVRRLPTIPNSQASSITPPRRTTPPLESSFPTSAAFFTPSKSSALSSFPLPSVMSPFGTSLRTPGVPLGPRTRSRNSESG